MARQGLTINLESSHSLYRKACPLPAFCREGQSVYMRTVVSLQRSDTPPTNRAGALQSAVLIFPAL